jgi:hypothetical protein
VTFFARVRGFSWKRIVGVNPLPRGASVGELGKILSPSKCQIAEIHETSSRSSFMKKVCVCDKRTKRRVQTSFRCFASSCTGMELMAKQGPCVQLLIYFRICDSCGSLERGNRGSMESGSRGNQEIEDRRSLGITDLRTYAFRSPKFGGHGWRIRESVGSQVKDAT